MNDMIVRGLADAPEKTVIRVTLSAVSEGDAGLDATTIQIVNEQLDNGVSHVVLPSLEGPQWIVRLKGDKAPAQRLEACRKFGHAFTKEVNRQKQSNAVVVGDELEPSELLAVAEGMALTNYQFIKYLKDADQKHNSLQTITIKDSRVSDADIRMMNASVKGTYRARDLVNEPLSFLTATELSRQAREMGEEAGFKVDVLGKKQIESLQMGGILAVNRGSVDPPTFSILEWAPENAVNEKPIVLVGKGVVYDTGGVSLKPTPNSMDVMKSDMGGAAAVMGATYAAALAELPLHVIALVPATDNRPGVNAYVPGDIIRMYNGLTVEVLNTDAEGRLLLGDALSYAQKYDPELVVDLATLTGAAVYTIGYYGIPSMGTADASIHELFKQSGLNTYERLAEMPFWDEYGEEMKSDIADLNNLGSKFGGAITAGKFLEFFTKDEDDQPAYPWLHFDIAGPSFMKSESNYRGKGGTGVGVRLLFDYLKNRAQ